MTKRKREDSDNSPKKPATESAVENNPCSICRKSGLPICKGHAPGGGGGSSSSDDADLTKSGVTDELTAIYLDKRSPMLDFETSMLKLSFDGIYGSMTLKPSGARHLTAEELEYLKEYLLRVEKSFVEFKKDLAEKGMSVKDFLHWLTDDNTKLLIKIPNPTYYAAFIRRLAETGLLPSPYMALKMRDEAEDALGAKSNLPKLKPKGFMEE